MRYVFALLLVCCSTHVNCQPLRKKLIIDTLVSPNKIFTILSRTGIDAAMQKDFFAMDSLSAHYSVDFGYIARHISSNINATNIPQISLEIQLDDSSALIDLPLDDSGGILTLKGMYVFSGDTIRLSKFTTFHNCVSDTIKSSLTWYKNYNADSSIKLKRLKSKSYRDKVVVKNCTSVYPPRLSYSINKKEYITLAALQKTESVQWFHGQRKMNKKRERLYIDRKVGGKPFIYFAGRVCTVKHHLSAIVELH